MKTKFDEIMDAFAARTGLAGLAPDAEGLYRFVVDGMELAVSALPDGRIVSLAEVGDVPPEGREQFYRTLLGAMFRLQGTNGAIFTVDEATDRVFLRRVDAAAPDLDTLVVRLDGFVGVLSGWRQRVADFRPGA